MKIGFVVLWATALAFLACALAALPAPQNPTPITPDLPAKIVDDNVNPPNKILDHAPVYTSFSGTPFGSPCRICPDDVIQGALNDCPLMSALAEVAIVSPGTIEKAIVSTGQTDSEGDAIYLTRQYDTNFASNGKSVPKDNMGRATNPPGGQYRTNGYPVSAAFPADKLWVGGRVLVNLNEGYFGSPTTPFLVFAQPPTYNGSFLNRIMQSPNSSFSLWSRVFQGSNGLMWPMLMEKGYAAMLQLKGLKGYVGFDNGLPPEAALEQITGVHADVYDINPENEVESVWVQDSPAMADIGGHSILGGLLRGDLHAVEPKLKICLTGVDDQRATCTQTCPEGHQCKRPLPGGGVGAPAAGGKMHVTIFDEDSTGEHPVWSHDVDPNPCADDKQPCTFQAPDSQWVIAGPVKISFTIGKHSFPLPHLDALLNQMQERHEAVLVSTVRPQDGGCNLDVVCKRLLQPTGRLLPQHTYFLRSYARYPGEPVGSNSLILGNPHGVGIPSHSNTTDVISLDQFAHAFNQIAHSATKREASACGCS